MNLNQELEAVIKLQQFQDKLIGFSSEMFINLQNIRQQQRRRVPPYDECGETAKNFAGAASTAGWFTGV